MFLSISLAIGTRILGTTRTNISRRTADPVYNEASVYEIKTDKIKELTLNVTAYYRSSENEDWQILGKVVVGSNADTNLGRKHWEAMLFSSKKPVAQWHQLTA